MSLADPGGGDDPLVVRWRARRGRFAADADVARSRVVRWALAIGGSIALALGVLGVFLPVLPTTPFVILAAACFFRSSARVYDAVLSNRVVGLFVFRWREERTIPPRAKAVAVTLIVLTLGTSIAFFVEPWPLRVMIAAVGIAVVVWLLRVPSRREPTEVPSDRAAR